MELRGRRIQVRSVSTRFGLLITESIGGEGHTSPLVSMAFSRRTIRVCWSTTRLRLCWRLQPSGWTRSTPRPRRLSRTSEAVGVPLMAPSGLQVQQIPTIRRSSNMTARPTSTSPVWRRTTSAPPTRRRWTSRVTSTSASRWRSTTGRRARCSSYSARTMKDCSVRTGCTSSLAARSYSIGPRTDHTTRVNTRVRLLQQGLPTARPSGFVSRSTLTTGRQAATSSSGSLMTA